MKSSHLCAIVLFGMVCTLVGASPWSASLPSQYEYYTDGGIQSGLSTNSPDLVLNGRPFMLYSGTLHYFRVPPERWQLTLRQMRAAGLNAVQTYVPWNAHEDTPGQFDFHSAWLDLDRFVRLAKHEDLFVVLRPGPFICAEWEFGGLPSWLLRDVHMLVRTNYPGYMDRVKLYWAKVMSIVNEHQFQVNGGPIIMLQLENEYFGLSNSTSHIQSLLKITRASGYTGQLFTSDNVAITESNDVVKDIPELIEAVTGNAQMSGLNHKLWKGLRRTRAHQPNRPLFESEYWDGWMDVWGNGNHYTEDLDYFRQEVYDVLFKANASINFYPFIGGTNFGFMSGGTMFKADEPLALAVTTSYDFDAPLTENGNYTAKYKIIQNFYQKLLADGKIPKLRIPKMPQVKATFAYPTINITSYYPFQVLLNHSTKLENVYEPVPMELLNLGPGFGQRYGFILYRIEFKNKAKQYKINGTVLGRSILMVNDVQVKTFSNAHNFTYAIEPKLLRNHNNLDLLVENIGRPSWAPSFVQLSKYSRRGIEVGGQILLDDQVQRSLTIYSMDFAPNFIQNVTAEAQASKPNNQSTCPGLFTSVLSIESEVTVRDTFVDMTGWIKGNVWVNGFNLGRYWNLGPQLSLYLPGSLLRTGHNHFVIFELHKAGTSISFTQQPIWK